MFVVFLSSPHCGSSNVTEDFEKSMALIRLVAYQIIGPILIILGLLGNVLNLIVLSRSFFNECTRIYLTVLAIGDFHTLLTQTTSMIRQNNTNRLTTLYVSIYFAHLEIVFVTTFIAFCTYIVLCLTIDRYVSVCYPFNYNSFHTKRRAIMTSLIAFIAALFISLPLIVLKKVCYKNGQWSFKDNVYVRRTVYWKAYIITSEVMIRIGPAVVLAILNMLIIREFQRLSAERSFTKRIGSTKSKFFVSNKYQDDKRLILLLQAVVILFFVTMIPSSCLSLLYSHYEEGDLKFEIFRAVANLLELANSSLNFCAYYLCSTDFRNSIANLLCQCQWFKNGKVGIASAKEMNLKF